jgi:MFS family permease
MGVYSGVSRTGSVAGNLVGGIGHDTLGFSMTLIGFSAISILAIPLGLISRKGLHHHVQEKASGEGSNSNALGLLFCGFVVGCVGSGLVMSTLGLVLTRVVGDSVTLIGMTIGVASLNGLFLSARWITDSIGAPVLGHVGDRLGRNRASVLFFTVGTATLLLALTMDTLVGIGLSVLVFFVCGVGLTTILMAQAGRLGSKTTARYVTASDFGSALGPALGWTSQQLVSSTDVIFIMGAVLYATGIITSRFTNRTSEAASSEVMK